ncbi:MAG: 50S ribosomal protein L5 [Patescibacteria group bacterium]
MPSKNMSLKQKFENEIAAELKKKLGLGNIYQIPKIEKVVVNCGIGRLVSGEDKKSQKNQVLDEVSELLSLITGQKPRLNQAKKSIAGFKLRQGETIGLSVTLRGQRMYDFLERFLNLVLPQVRDFRGIPQKSVSQNGILNFGIKEHIVFPETMEKDFSRLYGLQITVVPQVRDRDQALELYQLMSFPFQR